MTKLSKETEEKIMQLQLLEQNLQNLLLQKQTFQTQVLEIETALAEIEKVKDSAYKIIGSVMVLTKKDELKKDLFSKKEILELRIKNIEKQEQKIKEKSQEIQKEVAKEIK